MIEANKIVDHPTEAGARRGGVACVVRDMSLCLSLPLISKYSLWSSKEVRLSKRKPMIHNYQGNTIFVSKHMVG